MCVFPTILKNFKEKVSSVKANRQIPDVDARWPAQMKQYLRVGPHKLLTSWWDRLRFCDCISFACLLKKTEQLLTFFLAKRVHIALSIYILQLLPQLLAEGPELFSKWNSCIKFKLRSHTKIVYSLSLCIDIARISACT